MDLIETTLRQALATRVLAPAAPGIEITTIPLPEHPRLRGAAALVTAPLFAVPRVRSEPLQLTSFRACATRPRANGGRQR